MMTKEIFTQQLKIDESSFNLTCDFMKKIRCWPHNFDFNNTKTENLYN